MPWYFPWSESIKKRACRYLLQHYLGDFLKEKLALDQLTVDLYNGKGTVTDVPLDVWALNEMLGNSGVPLEMVDGFIARISVQVPWKALLSDSCQIEIDGMELTFAPKQKAEVNMLDSTYSWSSMSMTTSIQLAQECLKQETASLGDAEAAEASSFEGLEAFAQTIESVLARVKLSFLNTLIRFEHIPVYAASGVGVELRIDRIDYADLSNEDTGGEAQPQHTVYEPVAVAIKNFEIIGLSLYMDEFPQHKRTKLREATSSDEETFFNTLNESPPTPVSAGFSKMIEHGNEEIADLLPQVKILSAMSGKQNIRIRLKQNDVLPGPKFDLEYSLGAVSVFLTPRQLHLLIDALSSIPEAVANPSDSGSKDDRHKRAKVRAMKSEDYMRVEQSLQQNFVNPTDHHSFKSALDSLSLTTPNADDDRRYSLGCEEEFFSMTEYPLPALGQPPSMNIRQQTGVYAHDEASSSTSPRSTLSNVSLGGSSGSTIAKGSLTERASTVFKPATAAVNGAKLARKFSSPQMGLAGVSALDDAAEVTHMKVRSSNLIIFLLHQDPIKPLHFDHTQEHVLKQMSDNFFSRVGQYAIQSLFGVNSEEIQDSMLTLCSCDHIRILTSALTVEFESQLNSNAKTTNADVVIGKILVDENLYDEVQNERSAKTKFRRPYSQTQLLKFLTDADTPLFPGAFGSSQSPSVKIKYHKANRSRSISTSAQSRTAVSPKSQLTIEFGKVKTEVDLTITDRLVALLSPGPLYRSNGIKSMQQPMYSSLATGSSSNQQYAFRQAMDDSPVLADNKTDLIIKCSDITVNLRFPVPDLRADSDMDKRPWWKKAIHEEILQLEVSMLELKTSLHAARMMSSYELQFRKAKGVFVVPQHSMSYHMFDIDCPSEEGESGSMGLDLPRILINMMSSTGQSVFDDGAPTSKDSSPDSLEDQYPWMKAEPSPFSSQPAMYENEEMVMPGTKSEMNAFQESATVTSKLAINCYFPCVHLNLHSNDVFEIFYNRVFSDLLMWESLAPAAAVDPRSTSNPYENVHINLASHIGQLGGGDKFFMCKSAIRDAYDTQSEMDSFFSGDFMESPQLPRNEQSNLSFALHIDRGKIALFPPFKDLSSESSTTVTSQVVTSPNDSRTSAFSDYGHVVLNISDGHFFLVSGYKGQANVDMMEIYADNVDLYHSSTLDSSIDLCIMEDALCTDVLSQIVYMSDVPVLAKSKAASGVGTESTAMLSVAMKCTADVATRRKDNLVSVAVRGGTLRHFTLPPGESWLLQLMDFMDIKDYPILGYTFPPTVTTLHLHLWGCAVDYRPLHLPLQSLLMVEAFSLSSNIIPGSSTSVLRFIIEDSSFYLSNKIKEDVDLDEDYVQILDMGMFELSLRLTDGLDTRQPKVDLSMSNNLLNIRTCSDSCLAFMKLLKYFASDGDLQASVVSDDTEEDAETDEISSHSPALQEGEIDENHIGSLMADAMKDEDAVPSSQYAVGSELSPFQGTLLDECIDDSDDECDGHVSSSDEYCFLDSEKDNQDIENLEPTVRKLTNDDVVIIDDYFQTPLGRHDQLGSPVEYPPAVYRYTLKEISVLWQMYGGKDFDLPISAPSSYSKSPSSPGFSGTDARQRQQDRASPSSLRADHFSEPTISPTKHAARQRTQRHKGGPGRDLNTLMEVQLNKIRFQHDIYPEGCEKIYRNALLVYDFEVRDRLTSSQINKFLYQFSTEDMPRQSSANMLTIKFLVSRPEDTARSEEATLRVSLQPIRMNIDQDSLMFLKAFFSEVADDSPKPPPPSLDLANVSSSPSTEPFQAVRGMTPPTEAPIMKPAVSSESLKSEKSSTLFFRSFVFSPEVPIRLDYQGKHVSMEQGTLAGLLIGLGQLNCSEIRLKRLNNRSGLLGPDKLVNYVLTEWLNDIRQNQLQSILGGVGPAYSFVQLYQGIKDLFWMPWQQYRQDGRIVRGLQRGAHSFSTSTAMAVLELSNRLVTTIQSVAEMTFDMVSPGPSVATSSQSRHSSQGVHPADLREGVANAYNVLSEGLTQTATNIVKVATEEHEKKGMTGAVGGVLRQIPPTVVKPLILATEATSNVLGGARNQLAPDKRREAVEKWKSDS